MLKPLIGVALLAAQDQADRVALPSLRQVLFRVIQVQVHLPGVGVGERSDFQVDDDEAPEPPVKEQEIDPIPRLADSEATLTTNECEVPTKFE